jgi:ferric enterobactin receptor
MKLEIQCIAQFIDILALYWCMLIFARQLQNMKILQTLFISLFFSTLVLGQNKDLIHVKGTVADSGSVEVVPYAKVLLLSTKDASVAAVMLTDLNGKFKLEAPAGSYLLKVQFISYKEYLDTIVVTKKTYDVGTIKLHPESKALKEIVVAEEKRQVELSADKITYDPSRDLTVAGGTAADVLKNTPLVTVNTDGSVSLQGKPEVRILINGRQSNLTSAAALSQLPASSIEKIEVITNPSAKYDAEGGAGIINIVLKKNKKIGLNGMATLKGGIRHDDNAGINLGYGGSKWKTDGSYNLRYYEHYGTFMNTGTYNFPEQLPSLSTQDTKFGGKKLSNSGAFSVEFIPNEKNNFYSTVVLQQSDGDNYNRILNNYYLPAHGTVNTTNFAVSEKDKNYSVDYSLNYEHSYSKEKEKEKQKLTGNFSMSVNDHTKSQDKNHMFPATVSSPGGGDWAEQSYFTDLNKTYNLQADYVHPMKKVTFETGIKNAVRDLNSNFTNRNYDQPGGTLLPQPNQIYAFKYVDWIAEAYLNGITKIKNIDVQLGLRAEHTYMQADLHSAGTFHRDYLDLFPSLFLSREVIKSNTLSFSASRRINRPGIYGLYPFARYPDPFNVWKGNINLKPEYIYMFELSYSINRKKTTLISKFYYGISKNYMQEIRTVENGINIGKTENLNGSYWNGMSFNLNQTLTKWWSLNAFLNMYWAHPQGQNLGLGSSNFFGNMSKLTSNFKLPYKTDFQINTFYMGHMTILQMNQDPTYNIDLALKKELFKGKGQLTFAVNDIFNTRRYHFVNSNPNFTLDSYFYMQQYRYTLTFTYKFNNYKEARQKDIPSRGVMNN